MAREWPSAVREHPVFPEHAHPLGEVTLVLEGTFSIILPARRKVRAAEAAHSFLSSIMQMQRHEESHSNRYSKSAFMD